MQAMGKKYVTVVSVERIGDPKPTVRDELAATRTRPIDAPMATKEAWSGLTDYYEINIEIPWAFIGIFVVWTLFVFLIGLTFA